MFLASMAIFAFVISVAALGAAWLTISASAAGVTKLDSRIDLTNAALRALEQRIAKSLPEQVRAEVDDLRGALDVIRASNRKEFGSLWGRLGGRGANNGKTFDGETGLPLGTVYGGGGEADEEFDAMVALQGAKQAQ